MWTELDRRTRSEPYGWWGYGWRAPASLSVVELIERGTFDARTASTLWLMIERRASIVVAAEAPGAGKTTTLTALADFLPPGVARLYLRGWSETFAFLGEADPHRTYLLCNEISPHLPVYLWGRQVHRLFAAVAEGYGLGATMHAESLDEVVATLESSPLSVPRRQVARVDLVLTLAVDDRERRVSPSQRAPRRRLDALQLLRRGGTGDSFEPVRLAWWDPALGAVAHGDAPPPAGLLRRTGLDAAAFGRECARRAAFLSDLQSRGVREAVDVRRAIAAYAPPALDDPADGPGGAERP